MEKKKKIIVGCSAGVVAIVAAIGIGFWYNSYQAEQNRFALLPADSEVYTMELGSVTPSDASVFVDNENTSEKMQDTQKDIHLNYTEDQTITKEDGTAYLKVGDYEGTVTAGSQELPFTLHIVDTTAPEATLSQESISFEYGTDLTDHDWNQYISTSDLDETSITVEQAVDTHTAGSYTVKYIIVDPSGNSVEKELAVTVNEKPAPTTTSSGSGSSTSRRNTSSGSNHSSTNSGSSSSGSSSSGSTGSGSSSSGSSSSGSSSSSSGGLTPGQSWETEMQYGSSDRDGSYYYGDVIWY